jgi:hypothetical protein
MQPLRLFSCAGQVIVKFFKYENIMAIFKKVADDTYEILLEVNSNKFLILTKIGMNKIEQFEVLAVKGFVDLSLKLLRALKRIVYILYFEA